MGQITITGLDERVIASLTERAAAAGRTVEDEARAVLTQAATSRDRAALIRELDEIAAQIGPLPADWPGAAALIRQDRDAG